MVDEVLFEQREHLGIITLNRPNALNAVNLPMILAMYEQLQVWESNSSIHAVVLQAPPGKVFCAGGDVRWLYEAGKAHDPDQLLFFAEEYKLNEYIHRFSKPYIALLDGITMGGGVGISMHGSHPIASERFVFAMPETTIGFFPDIGASHLLHQCPGALGVYLALTGNRLAAQDVKQAGLLRALVPSERMSEVIPALLNLDLSDRTHEKVDECIVRLSVEDLGQESQIYPWIDQCFSENSVEEILRNLSGIDDSLVASIRKKSPLSLKVTLEQMHRTRALSLSDCLKIDYELVQHFMRGKDFYEGVRALLVDKDQNPQWNPASLELVSTDLVKSYFQ